MANLNENIKILEAAVNNPKAYLDKYLNDGKKIIGCFPMFVPEELVHAAGMIPVGLWGAQTDLFLAKQYLPAFACSIMQSCLELGLRGSYKGISAVIIPTLCDVFRCITQDWKSGVKDIKMIPITFPQNRTNAGAVEFLMSEYELVIKALKELGGEVTEESLSETIKVYNEHNAAIREFTEVANKHLDIVNPIVRHNVIKSSYFMEKSEHTAILKEINAELNKLPEYEWKGKKVVLTGITAEPDDFLQIFVDNNIAVVGDDLAHESQQFRTDIPLEGASAVERLAKQWCLREGVSLANDPDKKRGRIILDLVKKGKADGVVVCMMKFCDPEEYDYPMYEKELRAAGVPSVQIEMDQQTTSFEQARTRIQTFAEML